MGRGADLIAQLALECRCDDNKIIFLICLHDSHNVIKRSRGARVGLLNVVHMRSELLNIGGGVCVGGGGGGVDANIACIASGDSDSNIIVSVK